MVRDDILAFLSAPLTFAQDTTPDSKAAWLAGLDEVAAPALAAAGLPTLRPGQIAAWRGIAEHRAALLLGPPGTGKTYTMAWMALGYLEAHRRQHKPCKILVTGFTKSAIANLVESIVRAARIAGIPEPAIGFVEWEANVGVPRVAPGQGAVEFLEQEFVIVGMTCWKLESLMTRDGLAEDGHTAALFDLICLDEASQQVVSLGLLSLAGLAPHGRVLVAGDNKQLAPVRSTPDNGTDRALGGSVYDFLEQANVPVFPLDETFRLNAPLTSFPAAQFYANRYHSAGEAVMRRLELKDGWEQGLEEWERRVLDPAYPVVVLLHDGPAAGTRNPFEVAIATRLTKRLRERLVAQEPLPQFWQERLAIVSPHRNQNATIRKQLGKLKLDDGAVVETVDRIQGRERDAIIASYTVADGEFALAESSFIFAAERFNVTITRAKTKLILLVSRRLLEVVPTDEDAFDDAQVLREFVFGASLVQDVTMSPGANIEPAPVAIRVRGFDELEAVEVPALANDATTADVSQDAEVHESIPELNEHHEDLLAAIRRLAAKSKYGTAATYDLKKELLRSRDIAPSEFRPLVQTGWITALFQPNQYGGFWALKPLEEATPPHPLTVEQVMRHLPARVVAKKKGPDGARYVDVCHAFVWFDEQGQDRLWLLMESLKGEMGLVLTGEGKERMVNVPRRQDTDLPPPLPEALRLVDDDYMVLNALEDLDARRLNFGVYERWTTFAELAAELKRPVRGLGEVLRRLAANGHVLLSDEDDDRVISRMAEVGRELRMLKQRFVEGDALKRPYLVRSLKVAIKERRKPVRNQSLNDWEARLKARFAEVPRAGDAISGLAGMLRRMWALEDPMLAGFQVRALEGVLAGYWGVDDTDTFVVTADTGSGKTESACFPLIVGAAAEALRGQKGTRAILVYPRIQLAGNQAQRLTKYLAALAAEPGMPLLTIGLQNKYVPREFPVKEEAKQPYWPMADDGSYDFLFFGCPACDHPDLRLWAGKGRFGADRLQCPQTNCGWSFDGWIGSQRGLVSQPPTFFLPITESLHHWMMNPNQQNLFGVAEGHHPRAVLADEIHLYTRIHGAQVGYALRRLLDRLSTSTQRAVAVGMSATLGDPVQVWSEMVGRNGALLITPEANERELSPRGREYFYFLQPEIESRGKDVPGDSTSIQAIMCIGHGMRRRTGKDGGYRGVVFLDSIDKVKRLHANFRDAEEYKKLARLRTVAYPPHPIDKTARLACCQQPRTCDAFRDGECWYFAATDRAQVSCTGQLLPDEPMTVARTPVYSGSSMRTEEMIRTSDVVFATSTLEVGYDDPDMIFVYQHYAPLNLASFVQRKGRGGRGVDDRPVTGVTLSAYSPRDMHYFRDPEAMLDAASFRVPINMGNQFVLRGQMLAAIADVLAVRQARTKVPMPPRWPDEVKREADDKLRRIFGPNAYRSVEAQDLQDFLAQAVIAARLERLPAEPRDWAKAFDWIPNALFETTNLPMLGVQFKDAASEPALERGDEDITIALTQCAPGNVTRRYGVRCAHWAPPSPGRAPWSAVRRSKAIRPPGTASSADLLAELPLDVRDELEGLNIDVWRPERMALRASHEFKFNDEIARWGYDATAERLFEREKEPSKGLDVDLKSRGFLRGFAIVSADVKRAELVAVPPLAAITAAIRLYRGHPGSSGTGLNVTRVFWGADSTLVLRNVRGQREDLEIRQTFADETGQTPQLYGYNLETEGIELPVDSALLDRFVASEWYQASPEWKAWLRAQFLRYAWQRAFTQAGLNAFEAPVLAELLATAAAVAEERRVIEGLVRGGFHPATFQDLVLRVFRTRLSQHPLLTARRLERLLKKSNPTAMGAALQLAWLEHQDDEAIQSYLRSVVLHGMAIKLHQAFTIHGCGDDRQVLFHAKLPIQFGSEADDRLVVYENGNHGDGTTRTFVDALPAAIAEWGKGELAACPNATEDALIASVARSPEATTWRGWDPRHPRTANQLRAGLESLGVREEGAFQAAIRLLYGTEDAGAQRFTRWDLHAEVQAVRADIEQEFGRMASTWELVSAVTEAAVQRSPAVPSWSRLLEAYHQIEGVPVEGDLGPIDRLADQVHRLSARVCVDGCPSCLHTGSPLMPDAMAEVAVSRLLLEKFERKL